MFQIRPAISADARECVRLRALTRENAVSEERLASLGITEQSWASEIDEGKLVGWISESGGEMNGYCFGDSKTGEIVVLALIPSAEGQGIGRKLLNLVTLRLKELGHQTLFLGCAADPMVRSHGFYRHLGWTETGRVDNHGDDVLELKVL